MKLSKTISLLAGLTLLLLGACSKTEQEPVPGSDGIVLQFAPQGAVSTRVTGTDEENEITKLALWFFPAGAADDAVPLCGIEVTPDATGKATISDRTLAENGMTRAGTYDIYAVANLPSVITPATLGALKTNVYTATNRPTSPFCMSGQTLKHDFSQSRTAEIELVRQAVKLDITQNKESTSDTWTINKVFLHNDRKSANLFASATAPTPDTFADVLLISSTPGSSSPATYKNVYIYENLTATPVILEIEAEINGNNRIYVVPINVLGSAVLNRNSYLTLDLTLKDGSIDILTQSLPWTDQVSNTLDGDEPLTVAPAANSYLLKPGEEIYIPVSQIDNANKAYSPIPAISKTDHFTSELVWTETVGLLTEITPIGIGPEAVLKVKAKAGVKGNAVVSIKNKATGDIRWSWHIWVTDYNPDEAGNSHPVSDGTNTYTFMDRNLGAVAYGFTSSMDMIGQYYHHGRKDPFPKSDSWSSTDGPAYNWYNMNVYDANGVKIKRDYQYSSLTISESVKQPLMQILGQWNTTLWATDAKSVYDPCPPGWRVPSENAMQLLVGKFASFNAYQGAYSTTDYGSKKIYLPSTGYVGNDGHLSTTAIPYLWTSNTVTELTKKVLTVPLAGGGEIATTTASGVGNVHITNECNIRCVKDWK